MDGYRQGQFAVRSVIYYRRRHDTLSDVTAMKPGDLSVMQYVKHVKPFEFTNEQYNILTTGINFGFSQQCQSRT